MISNDPEVENEEMEIAVFDISRAHFMADMTGSCTLRSSTRTAKMEKEM